jgi:glycosyltransferase involved in cell wall biosynthesis
MEFKDKIKIFVLPMENDGCTHYRIKKPYSFLDKEIFDVQFIRDKEIETPEALTYLEICDYVVARQYHDKAIEILDNLFNHPDSKRKKPLKVILDMDDDVFNIDPYSDCYNVFGVKEVKHGDKWLWKDGVNINIKKNIDYLNSLEKFLARADIVTVSTERLKEKYSKYNSNIIVVPNAIDTKDWIVPNFKKHDDIRIGWTGGVSHYSDWWTIKDDIERIMAEYPQAKLCIAGAMFEGIFKNIDKDRVEFWDWVDPTGHGYRVAMMDLDLAIIPLKDSQFNSNKSCIKFYEFSSLKVPTICSNVPPYSDEAPKESLTNNFYESIKYYIENKDKAKEMAEKNYQWVMENRKQEDISKELHKILKNGLK